MYLVGGNFSQTIDSTIGHLGGNERVTSGGNGPSKECCCFVSGLVSCVLSV